MLLVDALKIYIKNDDDLNKIFAIEIISNYMADIEADMHIMTPQERNDLNIKYYNQMIDK